jgi:hypothetical protein
MDPEDRVVDLYKLEYERAAERYNNIYQSMWTIFSYLTAIAAGILTFGVKTGIESHELRAIALAPLLFWFWTTYLPLDRYGNEAWNCLGRIERTLNRDFGTTLDHFSRGADEDQEYRVLKPLFLALKAGNWEAVWGQLHRARFAICTIFIILHVIFAYQLLAWLW